MYNEGDYIPFDDDEVRDNFDNEGQCDCGGQCECESEISG